VLRKILHQPISHKLRRAERDQHGVSRLEVGIAGARGTRELGRHADQPDAW
jgi:hypothetical protein